MAPDPKPNIFRNQLLRTLAKRDLALLTPHLTPIDLALRHELEVPNKPIKDVFFLESGLASVVARGANRKELEVGLYGRDGMSGMPVLMGSDRSPNSTFIQLAGHGQQISADNLRGVMSESPGIREGFLLFVQSFMIQAAQTAISNGTGKLEERLARWLLMAHDRVDGDDLPLIHDFLARMLGVRRSGVTVALHSLEASALIKTSRGNITVVDRVGMERLANGSYGVPEAEYARLTGQRVGRSKARRKIG
jgi:CRP-like cAMP-binding protein